jgi:hypothetical protein
MMNIPQHVIAEQLLPFLDYQMVVRSIRVLNSDFQECVDQLYQPIRVTLRHKPPSNSIRNVYDDHEIFLEIQLALTECKSRNKYVFQLVEYLDISPLFESCSQMPPFYGINRKSKNHYWKLLYERLCRILRAFPNIHTLVLGPMVINTKGTQDMSITNGEISLLKFIAKTLPKLKYIAAAELVGTSQEHITTLADYITDNDTSFFHDMRPPMRGPFAKVTLLSQLNQYAETTEDHVYTIMRIFNIGVPFDSGIHFLRSCIDARHVRCVKFMLERGSGDHFRHHLNTCLLSALEDDIFNNDILQLLISYGADVNYAHALNIACTRVNAQAVDILLNAGYDIFAPQKRSPIVNMVHASRKHSKETVQPIMRTLLKRGIPLTNCDANGNNVLHLIAETNTETIIECIVDASEIINGKNKHGATPIQYALKRSYSYYNDPVIPYLIKQGADLESVDDYGNTMLHYWARGGGSDSPVLDMISTAKPNKYGIHPVHVFACSNIIPRNKSVMKALSEKMSLAEEINLKAILNEREIFNSNRDEFKTRTLLSEQVWEFIDQFLEEDNPVLSGYMLFAITHGKYYDVLNEEMRQLEDVNYRDSNGRHLVHVLHRIPSYLDNIADWTKMIDKKGRTPAFYVAKIHPDGFLSHYNMYSPDLNHRDHNGETPLIALLQNESIEMETKKKILCAELPSEIQHIAVNGDSLMHIAVRTFFHRASLLEDHSVIVLKLMRKRGVDVHHRNNDGLTAAELYDRLYGHSMLREKVMSILSKSSVLGATKCKVCSKVFSSEGSCQQHVTKCHNK